MLPRNMKVYTMSKNAMAIYADPFEAYADSVRPQYIVGQFLRFSKGDYIYGENGQVMPEGTELTANVDELTAGFVRWREGKPVENIMVRVADGRPVLPRSELGHHDQAEWEHDDRGQPRDPWQFTNYLPMLDAQGELYTFTTSSRGGIEAVAVIARSHGRHWRKISDEFPTVRLSVSGYQHPNKAFGRIKVPKIIVTGWQRKAVFHEALLQAGYVPSLRDDPSLILDAPPTAPVDDVPPVTSLDAYDGEIPL